MEYVKNGCRSPVKVFCVSHQIREEKADRVSSEKLVDNGKSVVVVVIDTVESFLVRIDQIPRAGRNRIFHCTM